jgi:Fic family protein
MSDALRRIEQGRKVLEERLSKPEAWHGAIRRQVMASVVHYSTKIEGNKLTREQVESIIAGEIVEAPEKDKTEAINYLRAMQWAQTRADDPDWQLSHDSITTLHFLIGQNLGADYAPLGKYREVQNQVSDKKSGVVIYWPPRTPDVRPLMDEFVTWVRHLTASDVNVYIANALAHLAFVALHPFSDGNGRVSRVLCSLLMMREGYKAQAFYSLEEYFGIHWEDYGLTIEAALGPRWDVEKADCTKWIEWYLEAVAEQVDRAADIVRTLVAEITVFAALMLADGQPPNGRPLVALWLAKRDGQVTNRTYRAAIDVSPKTAATDLSKLVTGGYLTSLGQKRGTRYVLGPRLANRDYEKLVDVYVTQGAAGVWRTLKTPTDPSDTLFDVG